MTETKMRKKLIKELGNVFEFESIETGSTKIGVADLYYTSKVKKYVQGWIELKQANVSYNGVTIPYRPGQQNWLRDKESKGINVFILLHTCNNFWLLKNFDSILTKSELMLYSLWNGEKFNGDNVHTLIEELSRLD